MAPWTLFIKPMLIPASTRIVRAGGSFSLDSDPNWTVSPPSIVLLRRRWDYSVTDAVFIDRAVSDSVTGPENLQVIVTLLAQ